MANRMPTVSTHDRYDMIQDTLGWYVAVFFQHFAHSILDVSLIELRYVPFKVFEIGSRHVEFLWLTV